jgi:hypothetical protein
MSDESLVDIARDILNIFNIVRSDAITRLRTPTPIKTVTNLITDANGCIGHGLDTPDPQTIFRCPSSHEAWINRITVTSPQYPPATPLTVGECLIIGSSGEIIAWLPREGDLAPVQILEGRLSAPHLNASEELQIVGDQMPVGISLRIDLQIILETGLSEFTPKWAAPGDIRNKSMFANL